MARDGAQADGRGRNRERESRESRGIGGRECLSRRSRKVKLKISMRRELRRTVGDDVGGPIKKTRLRVGKRALRRSPAGFLPPLLPLRLSTPSSYS